MVIRLLSHEDRRSEVLSEIKCRLCVTSCVYAMTVSSFFTPFFFDRRAMEIQRRGRVKLFRVHRALQSRTVGFFPFTRLQTTDIELEDTTIVSVRR